MEHYLTNEDEMHEELEEKMKCYWRSKQYWKLPENVRNAVDIAHMKQKHSQFWYKLQNLNDKIFVFR